SDRGFWMRHTDVEDRARGPARVGHSGTAAEGTPGSVGGVEPVGQTAKKGKGAVNDARGRCLLFPFQRLDHADARLRKYSHAKANRTRKTAIYQAAVLQLCGVERHRTRVTAIVDF